MLHPVGKLPAAVYWRRRAVLLTLVLAVFAAGAWLGVTKLSAREAAGGAVASATVTPPVPALERVVPSLGAVATPTPPLIGTGTVPAAATTAPAAVPGGPCTDDMISLQVRTPGTAAVGSKPTFELLVANISAVPCVRALDKGLQELLLYDATGTRIWGSNDCFPEASSDPRTLAPGDVVTLPVVWGGLTSEPSCTAARANPGAGNYLVRGRLDTKTSPDAPFVLN